MLSRHTWLTGALATLIGVAGALACTSASRPTGPSLPKAGSPEDDGTGLLARWSRGGHGGCEGEDCATGGDVYGYYGGDVYGYYGGDTYGYYGGDYYGYYGGDPYGGYAYGYGGYWQPEYKQPPPQVVDYAPMTTVSTAGTIEGVVKWKNAPAALATIKGVKGSACEKDGANPTLVRSSSGGVGATLVYLADIRSGKNYTGLGGTVEQRDCVFSPHMQIAAPIGVVIQFANQDLVGHELRIRALPDDRRKEQKDELLPVPTMRIKDHPLVEPGIYEVTTDEESGAGVAWIVVPRHPYYAVTDEDGRFRFDDVPAGEYTLVAWHEPVATSVDTNGRMIRGNPVETRIRVKVSAGQIVPVDVSLP